MFDVIQTSDLLQDLQNNPGDQKWYYLDVKTYYKKMDNKSNNTKVPLSYNELKKIPHRYYLLSDALVLARSPKEAIIKIVFKQTYAKKYISKTKYETINNLEYSDSANLENPITHLRNIHDEIEYYRMLLWEHCNMIDKAISQNYGIYGYYTRANLICFDNNEEDLDNIEISKILRELFKEISYAEEDYKQIYQCKNKESLI